VASFAVPWKDSTAEQHHAEPRFALHHASAGIGSMFRELVGATTLKLDEASMELLNRASDWRR